MSARLQNLPSANAKRAPIRSPPTASASNLSGKSSYWLEHVEQSHEVEVKSEEYIPPIWFESPQRS
jgi:hypothetical protein